MAEDKSFLESEVRQKNNRGFKKRLGWSVRRKRSSR